MGGRGCGRSVEAGPGGIGDPPTRSSAARDWDDDHSGAPCDDGWDWPPDEEDRLEFV